MKTKVQDGREWQCSCEPCYNCRVNLDAIASKPADTEDSKPKTTLEKYAKPVTVEDPSESIVCDSCQ